MVEDAFQIDGEQGELVVGQVEGASRATGPSGGGRCSSAVFGPPAPAGEPRAPGGRRRRRRLAASDGRCFGHASHRRSPSDHRAVGMGGNDPPLEQQMSLSPGLRAAGGRGSGSPEAAWRPGRGRIATVPPPGSPLSPPLHDSCLLIPQRSPPSLGDRTWPGRTAPTWLRLAPRSTPRRRFPPDGSPTSAQTDGVRGP